MRKHSDSNPPELNRDSRPINSTIRRAKYKRPNALKRGVYATPPSFPGKTGRSLTNC
jgi:hypothetical protein